MDNTELLDTAALDADVAALRAAAGEWAATPLAGKRRLLEAVRAATAAVADEWVRVCCQGKGIPAGTPASGEEWMSGPYALLSSVAALIRLLKKLEAGADPLERLRARTLAGGQVALRVFPSVPEDRLVLGYSADVWLRPGVSLDQAREGVARRLRDPGRPGRVALVLGAGNISSIPPLDALAKLYQDNTVALIKLNPVNAYLEPVLDRALAPFVERGFVRVTSGAADVGAYLAHHPEVDTVHITGNVASHDALVFGPGAEGARRRHARQPLLTKPVTSELGGVGPVVVVGGRWSDAALRAQAENVATQRLHNSGFNCIASQVVVLPRSWPQADRFLEHLRRALRAAPDRRAWYPGAADRQRAAAAAHPGPSCSAATPRRPGPCWPTWTPATPPSPPSGPSTSARCSASPASPATARPSSWIRPWPSATSGSRATWGPPCWPRPGPCASSGPGSRPRSPGCATAPWPSTAGSARSSACPGRPGAPTPATNSTTSAAGSAWSTTPCCSTPATSSAPSAGARSVPGPSRCGP